MTAILSQAQRRQMAERPLTAPITIPSPGGGWNTRDSFDGMDPLDATQLDNWFPDAGGGMPIRGGYQSFASGMGTPAVQTLAELATGAVNKFIAACDGHIWDISTGTPSSLGTGFTSDKWQTVSFLGKMILVNGVDTAQTYDGTTLANAAFTGVTQSTLVGVWQYQQRLFFWQANSTKFWYALLNSTSGALASFDLGSQCPRGGNIIAMTTFSYDGGNNVQDYAAFVMSSGDVLVYQGNDPALLSGWVLAGVYRLSPPVSGRAITNYGGDAFLTTYDDHVSFQAMFTALRAGQMPPRSKVSGAVRLAVQANKSGFGWQALFYPRGRSLIFNIPNTNGTFNQHVCNTGLQNTPWCRYVGMNARCFGLFNDRLYFGGANGTVYLADQGSLDNGRPIQATALQAWTKFGQSTRKRVSNVRPILQSAGGIAYTFPLAFDYKAPTIVIPPLTAGVGSPWDTSPWDTSPWSSEINIDSRWRIGGGTGTAIQWGVVISARQPVSWLRTDLRVEGGVGL